MNCSSLSSVTSLNPTPPVIEERTFADDTYKNATLYVPNGSKTTYWLHPYWEKFANIVELDASSIESPSIEKGCSTIYDLRGTKRTAKAGTTEALPKGIYVKDGKKVLVK